MERSMERYLQEIADHLILPARIRQQILDDLETEFLTRLAEGENSTEILATMSAPAKLAQEMNDNYHEYNEVAYYEYKSDPNSDFPLLHIVIPKKRRDFILPSSHIPTAKGLLAFGVKAYGVFALGFYACGLISLGLLSFGLFSLGIVSVGLLVAGCIGVGAVAVGNLLFALFAIGNIAFCYAGLGNIISGGYGIGNVISVHQGIDLPNACSNAAVSAGLNDMLAQLSPDSLAAHFFKSIKNISEHPVWLILLILAFVILIAIIVAIIIRRYQKVAPVFKQQ